MKNKSLIMSLFAVLVLAASNSMVLAVDCPSGGTVWTHIGTGDWFNAENWDNDVPDIRCGIINNGGVATIDDGFARAPTLYLGYSQGDSGSVVVDGANLDMLLYFPKAPCNGAIYVGRKGTGNLTIQNGGTVTSRYLYIGASTNPSRPNSTGTVTVESGASLMINAGEECEVDARICIGCDADSIDGGTGVLNIKDGTVEVDNLGTVSLPGVRVGPSGTLEGNSTLTLTGSSGLATTMRVRGTVAPSGTLTIAGNLDLTDGGSTSHAATTIFHVSPTVQEIRSRFQTAQAEAQRSLMAT